MKNLETAFRYVYVSGKNVSPHSQIWPLNLSWLEARAHLQKDLLAGNYLFIPVSSYAIQESYYSSWSSIDVMALNAVSLILTPYFINDSDNRCVNLLKNARLKHEIKSGSQGVSGYSFVIKANVHQYFDPIKHEQVLEYCQFIKDPRILSLIAPVLNRCEVRRGEHVLIIQVIPEGCTLLQLLGNMMKSSLRRFVKAMHQMKKSLSFKLTVDKTFIGRITKESDFLGYCFTERGLIGLAKKTIQNFNKCWQTFYEQRETIEHFFAYDHQWKLWCAARLGGLFVPICLTKTY